MPRLAVCTGTRKRKFPASASDGNAGRCQHKITASTLQSPYPSTPKKLPVFCREITLADRDDVVALLARGFQSRRSVAFWRRAFDRLSAHATPAGCPTHGYVLQSGDNLVGVILLIFVHGRTSDGIGLRCNVSSWYVDPAFRMFAGSLAARALQRKDVTYFNITPAPHTRPILAAQGYVRYCDGEFVAVPLLSQHFGGTHVEAAGAGVQPGPDLSSDEVALLLAHRDFGCLSVVCHASDGRHPFVFALRRRYGVVRVALLIYCRMPESFARFAGPLGTFLAKRAVFLVMISGNGPVAGLVGTYRLDRPHYFKGSAAPPLGDLAYSEAALFGV